MRNGIHLHAIRIMLVRGGNRAAADADRQRGLPVPRMPAQGSRTSFARATSLMTERHLFPRDQAALGGKVPRDIDELRRSTALQCARWLSPF
jgi:hypothetical protein